MTSLNDWTVFVVDDEADSRELIYDILTQHGATVLCASGAVEFEQLWTQTQPTLIVLDLAMPKPDGWDLLDQIRARPERAGIPIVAITAHHSTRVKTDAIRAGFAMMIPKPIRSAQFIETLQMVVGANGKNG